MVSESVYVTVAIACVVTLLVVAVIVIYCIKRQQDKEQWRQAQEERARQERQRRQIRGNVVRPPPYCPRRRSIPQLHYSVPFTPPPAYKEMASPTPPTTQVVGIGGPAYPPPTYDPMPAVGHSVPPTTTTYNHHNNYMQSHTASSTNVARPYPTNAPSSQVAASSARRASHEAVGITPSDNRTPRASDSRTPSALRRRSFDPPSPNQITIPSYDAAVTSTNQAARTSYDAPSTSTNQVLRTSTNQATRTSTNQATRSSFDANSTSTNQTTRASIAHPDQRIQRLDQADAYTSHFTATQSRHGVNIAANVQHIQGVIDENTVTGASSTGNNAARRTTRETTERLPQSRVDTRNIEDLSLI